jgi:hypothetical protein
MRQQGVVAWLAEENLVYRRFGAPEVVAERRGYGRLTSEHAALEPSIGRARRSPHTHARAHQVATRMGIGNPALHRLLGVGHDARRLPAPDVSHLCQSADGAPLTRQNPLHSRADRSATATGREA